jgi:predicted transcriptional regulator
MTGAAKQERPAAAPALSEREREVLNELDDQWVRPMDIGGRDAGDHSRVLRALVRKGLAEKRRRNSLANWLGSSRGSYVYRKAQAEKKA